MEDLGAEDDDDEGMDDTSMARAGDCGIDRVVSKAAATEAFWNNDRRSTAGQGSVGRSCFDDETASFLGTLGCLSGSDVNACIKAKWVT